jgi:hypothetical protein
VSLTFTSAGAVAAPDTLQIRIERGFEGRVAAGAPSPSRALTDAEVADSLRRFTVRGPRVKPVTGLVLSGLDVPARGALATTLAEGRSWGIRRVVLHLPRRQREAFVGSPLLACVDAVAVAVTDDADLADVIALSCRAALEVTAVVLLDEPALGRLAHVAAGLLAARPRRVVLQWPLPNGAAAAPPHVDRVTAAILAVVPALEAVGIAVTVKGMPACSLGPLASRATRTANRWYVDADHLGDRALLFQPDVVRFVHPDECRFCARADTCDGVAEAWWRAGVAGRLRAIDDRAVTTSPTREA